MTHGSAAMDTPGDDTMVERRNGTGAENVRPPKVLITKIGLDGHDRGSRIVAAFLRDAGMEVVYTDPWQEIPRVIDLVQEEDVELVGISSLASDHRLVPKLMAAMREAGLHHVAVIVGGIIPDVDVDELLAAGVARVFHPGTGRGEIVDAVNELVVKVRTQSPKL